jgi:hypothetical protein
MTVTTIGANKALDAKVGRTAYPTTIYVALYTVTPTTAGGGTETVYTNYARVQLTSTNFGNAAASGSTSNSVAIAFPACGATGATIVAWGICDASSGGNILDFGSCSLIVSSGITPSFAIGQLTLTAS